MEVLVDVRNPADFLLPRGKGSYIFISVLLGCKDKVLMPGYWSDTSTKRRGFPGFTDCQWKRV